MRAILITTILLFGVSANASTIDIDISTAPCTVICAGTYSIDGFDITTSDYFRNLDFWGFDFEQTLTMERSSGGNFGLESISSFISSPWLVTGYYAGGGTVQVSIGVSGPFNFDSSWQDLEKVEFIVQPGSLDSIKASVVPIPAAVWLFGSALAGLGWIRRKQSA